MIFFWSTGVALSCFRDIASWSSAMLTRSTNVTMLWSEEWGMQRSNLTKEVPLLASIVDPQNPDKKILKRIRFALESSTNPTHYAHFISNHLVTIFLLHGSLIQYSCTSTEAKKQTRCFRFFSFFYKKRGKPRFIARNDDQVPVLVQHALDWCKFLIFFAFKMNFILFYFIKNHSYIFCQVSIKNILFT